MRIATFGCRSAVLIAALGARPWAETTSASSHAIPSRANATATGRRRGVDDELVGQRGERADDAEEPRVAGREHDDAVPRHQRTQGRVEVLAEHDVLLVRSELREHGPATGDDRGVFKQRLGAGRDAPRRPRRAQVGGPGTLGFRPASCSGSAAPRRR